MRTRRIPQLATSLTVALALVAALAGPAGATPVAPTSGTISIGGLLTLDLTPGAHGTPPCPAKPSTLDLTANGTTTSGTLSLTDALPGTRRFTTFFQWPGFPAWYQADITFLTSDLTYTAVGSPPVGYNVFSTGNHLVMRMDIYQVPSCDKANLRCTLIWQAALGIHPSYTTNTLPTWTPGLAPLVLNASTSGGAPVQISNCNVPFTALGGAGVSMLGITIE
jgi:hypothetical protein